MLETLFNEFFTYIVYLILIFFCSLGVVYTYGRLLNENATDAAKNKLAIFATFLFSFLSRVSDKLMKLHETFKIEHPLEALNILTPIEMFYFSWEVIIIWLASIVIYVILGWRFYDRINNFLDKTFATGKRRNKGASKRK